MACLHLINHVAALGAALEVAHPQDCILLIEDGVYAAVNPSGRRLRVLDEDVQARGLQGRLHDSSDLATYADFVDLVVAHHPVISWR